MGKYLVSGIEQVGLTGEKYRIKGVGSFSFPVFANEQFQIRPTNWTTEPDGIIHTIQFL